jgi:anti-sigma factor RsiW
VPKKTLNKIPGEITSCKEEVTLIGDYLSSSLSARVAAAFETHMKACPDCVAFLQTYKKTIEATRAFLKTHPATHRQRKLSLRPLDGSGARR